MEAWRLRTISQKAENQQPYYYWVGGALISSIDEEVDLFELDDDTPTHGRMSSIRWMPNANRTHDSLHEY
jgi:hypothetical protein